MKKLITGILATLACFACLTGCELLEPVSPDTSAPTSSSVPTDGAIDLEGAKAYADDMFRTSNTSVRADYELPNFLNYDNLSYPLSWSVNVTEGVAVEVKDDKTIINVDETLLTELEYTLTLTIADPTDATKTVTVNFNRIVEAAPSKVPAKITEAPKEETPYKLHIYHAQLQSDNYLTGDIYKTYEYYFAITTDYDKAIDIYVEAVEGEEGMFYMFHNGTETLTGKHYINARKTSDNKHISNYYETTAETKWFFDEEIGTMVTTINDLEGNDTKFFLGCDTDPSHKSVSPQSDANANKGYLIEMVDRTTVSNADKIAQTKKELAVSPVFVGAGEMKLPTQGTTFPDATIAWTATGATYADGTLTFAAPTAATTVTLTATISCGDATADTKELTVNLVPNTPEAILDATAILKSGETYANEVTLTGIVSEFMKISNSEDGTYNEQYGNISVKLMVAYNDTYKTIGCYHISGVGTADVQPGYTIKVTGFITNHNGSAQFAQDSKLEIVKTGTDADIPTIETEKLDTPEKILNAAYALAEGTALEGTHSLTGKITSIDEQYSTQYQNITVTITVDGFTDKPMKCYHLKGTGAENLKVGDTITVSGTIKNYYGTIEFDNGCTFTNLVPGEGGGNEETPDPTPTYETLTITQALEKGNALENYGATTEQYYVSGTIINIADATKGNLYLADAAGNVIYVFGTTAESGVTLAVGNNVKLLALVSKFADAAQLKTATAVEVTASTLNSKQAVLADKYALTTMTEIAESGSVDLTVSGTYGSTIAWTVSPESAAAVIASNKITYTLQAEATTVTLTATIIKDSETTSVTFTVKIAALPKAGETTTKYTFSDYTAGTQYKANEEHKLDDNITVTVDDAHFTTQLRLYDSTGNNGHDSTAVISSAKVINKVTLNAGNSAATLKVYASVDGTTWTEIKSITTTKAYADHTVEISADSNYKYLKLDAVGAQVRIAYMELTVVD